MTTTHTTADVMETCATDTDQQMLMAAVVLLFEGFVENDLRKARTGASIMVAAQRSGVSETDLCNVLIATIDVYNGEFGWLTRWDRRVEFAKFGISQVNRVYAIIHSTKVFNDRPSNMDEAVSLLRKILEMKGETDHPKEDTGE